MYKHNGDKKQKNDIKTETNTKKVDILQSISAYYEVVVVGVWVKGGGGLWLDYFVIN